MVFTATGGLIIQWFSLSFVTQLFPIPSSRNSVSVLSFDTKQLSSLLSASGFPLTCIIKWLSSLLYHQTVVLSPLSPNGCPPLSQSSYPLSSITEWLSSLFHYMYQIWLSSLLYQQMVVLSPLSPNGCPPLSPNGYPLSSITRWLSSLLFHQMVVLLRVVLSSLSPNGCLFYHQVVVLSPLSPNGCPYIQVVILSP